MAVIWNVDPPVDADWRLALGYDDPDTMIGDRLGIVIDGVRLTLAGEPPTAA